MKALIISNGDINDYKFYKNFIEDYDFIICADGGTNHAYKMGIIPTIIIGDLDSIENDVLEFYKKKNVKIQKFPTSKDETDTQLAMLKAIEMKADDITFIGAIGSRFDHSFANIALLHYLLKRDLKGKIINEKNEIYLIDKNIEISGNVGDLISLIPYMGDVKGIYTKGLYFSLSGEDMSAEMPYGVSNYYTEKTAYINISSGLLLVIKVRE